MPVEKTIEEFIDKLDKAYNTNTSFLLPEVRLKVGQIISEVKSQVRREVVEEIYEGIHIFDHYNKIDKDIKELLNIEFKDSIKRFALSKGIILKN